MRTKKNINADLKKFLENKEWKTPFIISNFLDTVQELFNEKYWYNNNDSNFLTVRNELYKIIEWGEKATTSNLIKNIVDIEKTKENIKKMVDNPWCTVDFHSLEYWAKHLEYLRDEIQDKI